MVSLPNCIAVDTHLCKTLTPSPSSSYNDELLHGRSPLRQFKDRLILGTKEIEFTVPQTLSPITPTHGRISAHGFWSGDSSPGSGRSESDLLSSSLSRGNSPSPIFFSSNVIDSAGSGYPLYGLNPELYKEEEYTDDSEEKNNSFDKDSQKCSYVSFHISYDQVNEQLHISDLKGHYFKLTSVTKDEEMFDISQSYLPRVRIFLYPDERRILQSSIQTVERGKYPEVIEYDETFGFQVSEIELEESSIQICFDTYDNKHRKYKLFGYARAHLKNLDLTSQKQILKEKLICTRDENKLEEKPLVSGEIFVSLWYNSNISRLTISLFDIKGIKFTGNETGVYAKILFDQNSKNVKTKKTSSIPIPENPDGKLGFNESFNFKLNPDQIESATLTIKLRMTYPGYSKYHEIGIVVLGPSKKLGKGASHWAKMMKKQKEQIQCWHSLIC